MALEYMVSLDHSSLAFLFVYYIHFFLFLNILNCFSYYVFAELFSESWYPISRVGQDINQSFEEY